MSTSEPIARFRHVTKTYDGITAVVRDLNLDVARGEFLTLLGPSGSGKTTTLMMLAGFQTPSSGEILLQGKAVHRTPPHRRGLGVVFQSYALFPHMSVAENVAFPLTIRRVGRAERDEKVARALALVRLNGLDERRPAQLSGGQQQRVALARSLAKGPKLLLLDEPMAALDKKLRTQMQLELVDILERLGVTCIMVTHDQEEAMTMAGRIALMDRGAIRQIGTPDEIYEQPSSRFTAEFIGSINVVAGKVRDDAADYITIEAPELGNLIHIGHGVTCFEGQEVSFAIRPEKVRIGKERPPQPHNCAHGTVQDIAYFGSHSVYHVRLDSGRIVQANFMNAERWASESITWNDAVWVSWDDNAGLVLTA